MHLKRQLDFFFAKTCGADVAESGTRAHFILVGNLSVDDFHNRLAFCTCSVIQEYLTIVGVQHQEKLSSLALNNNNKIINYKART